MKKIFIAILLVITALYGCSRTATSPTTAQTTSTYAAATATPDMKKWTQGERYCDFQPRYNHSALAMGGKIFVIAGRGVSGCVNDVWTTEDCEYWVSATASAAFTPRELFGAVNFDKRIWVIAGAGVSKNAAENYSDSWYSYDGVSWTAACAPCGFEKRVSPAVVVFNNAVYLIGGCDSRNYYNDVWSSKDGKSWARIKENNDKGFSPRCGHAVYTFGNKLWVVAGASADGQALKDVWNSENGVDWKLSTINAGFSARKMFSALTYKERMWAIGGINAAGEKESDIWWSVNGYYWVSATAKTDLGQRAGAAALEYKDKVWLISGNGPDKIKRDIWWAQ